MHWIAKKNFKDYIKETDFQNGIVVDCDHKTRNAEKLHCLGLKLKICANATTIFTSGKWMWWCTL